MEVRITFRSEIYIEGEDLNEIRKKWYQAPLFDLDTCAKHRLDFVEFCSAERVDDDSYSDVKI